MSRRAIAVTAFAAFALVAAACGQYPGIHEQTYGAGGPGAGPAGIGLPAPGATSGPGLDSGIPGTDTTGPGGTTTTTGPGGTTPTGGPGDPGGGPAAPTGGDSTGVTDTTITIGIHAPLTGAAPLKASSFEKGKDLYWKGVEIYGRQVQVVFQDDQYNPSHATDVCQQMADQDNAFLLIGGGGTDQIQACAQYAASQGIPYLSAGVTEVNMRNLPNYFALSKSYPQQVPLLADFIRKNKSKLGWGGDESRLAMVVTNTVNFDDARAAWEQEFPGAAVLRHEKNERGNSMAGRLCAGPAPNYDVVFPLTAPTYYLEMAGASACRPQYVGVGITHGLDQVASTGCRAGRSTEGAYFFSPAPAFADSDRYAPEFRQAGGGDDIMFLLWGLSAALHQLFEDAGENLTREGFIAAASQASIRTGVFPDVQYSQSDHFGAKQVHLLRNVCSGSGGNYVTERAFVSSF